MIRENRPNKVGGKDQSQDPAYGMHISIFLSKGLDYGIRHKA